jgi:transposase
MVVFITTDNILLVFQPPYSPELNPIERLWQYLKQHLSWENYQNLDSLKEKVSCILEEVSPEIIVSLTGWNYILSALSTVA